MFTVAICDDEKCTCSELEKIVLSYAKRHNISISVEIFYSGEGLCAFLKNHAIDLVFLDIELESMNGVEVGRFLRQGLKNDLTQIVYISSKESYAMELFKVRPMYFLLNDCMSVLYKQEIENQIIEEQMNSCRHQLKLIERSNANIRQLRHDMKHHLLMIHNLTQKEQTQQVYAYLQDIKSFSENPIEYVNTGNEAIDSMLNYKILYTG
jgi:DNA-binding LytR/AlgR family response regulator